MSGLVDFFTGGNIKVAANRIASSYTAAAPNYPLTFNTVTMEMASNAINAKNSHYIQLVIDNKIKNLGELTCLFLNTFIAPKNTPFRHTTGDFEEEVRRYLKNKGIPEKYISGDNTHLTEPNCSFFPDLSREEALTKAEGLKKKLMGFLKSRDADNAIDTALQITCLTESRLGPQNKLTADSYADIGYASREANDYASAVYWFECSKDIFLLQSDYGKVVDRMCDLANLKSVRGEIRVATLALESAIEFSKKHLGVAHPKADYPRALLQAINSPNWTSANPKKEDPPSKPMYINDHRGIISQNFDRAYIDNYKWSKPAQTILSELPRNYFWPDEWGPISHWTEDIIKDSDEYKYGWTDTKCEIEINEHQYNIWIGDSFASGDIYFGLLRFGEKKPFFVGLVGIIPKLKKIYFYEMKAVIGNEDLIKTETYLRSSLPLNVVTNSEKLCMGLKNMSEFIGNKFPPNWVKYVQSKYPLPWD